MTTVSENSIGIGFLNVHKGGSRHNPMDGPLFAIGTIAQAIDGNHYQYVQASEAIPANTSSCLVGGDFTMAASGGSTTSPPEDMEAGDYGWVILP